MHYYHGFFSPNQLGLLRRTTGHDDTATKLLAYRPPPSVVESIPSQCRSQNPTYRKNGNGSNERICPSHLIPSKATDPMDPQPITTIWKVQKSEGKQRLPVSRAFDDFDSKTNDDLSPEEQMIVCTSDIRVHQMDNDDLYLVLACEGVWDVMNDEKVGRFAHEKAEEIQGEPEREIVGSRRGVTASVLLKNCLDLRSSDNMSVLIVAFSFCGGIERQKHFC